MFETPFVRSIFSALLAIYLGRSEMQTSISKSQTAAVTIDYDHDILVLQNWLLLLIW